MLKERILVVDDEEDILVYSKEERVLSGHGSALRDAKGRRVGALIVLNDVSRLRRLENIRKDFVANVSHEIKTPITAIKGFAETLRDSGEKTAEETERFLGIIHKHVNRLEAIQRDKETVVHVRDEGRGISKEHLFDYPAGGVMAGRGPSVWAV